MLEEIIIGNDPTKSLKEIVGAIKESGEQVVTVDPMTGTFMEDGFVASGMKASDNSRVKHASAFEAFDLGFAKVFIDPSFSDTKIVFKEKTIKITFETKLF